MDNNVYLFILALFIIAGLFHYKIIQLEKKLNESNAKRAKDLVDAGQALTDALKKAFDNIKTLNQKHERLSRSVKEIETRVQGYMIHDKKIIRQRFQNVAKNKETDKISDKIE